MRDIRDDLRFRLEAIATKIETIQSDYERKRQSLEAEYRHAMNAAISYRNSLLTLLEVENAGGVEPVDTASKTPPQLPLAEFFITKLFSSGPMTKEELRDAAIDAGFFDEGGAGRPTHTTLMNIVGAGKIIRDPEGRYRVPDARNSLRESLFNFPREDDRLQN